MVSPPGLIILAFSFISFYGPNIKVSPDKLSDQIKTFLSDDDCVYMTTVGTKFRAMQIRKSCR
jgi:hypothetical protein